MGAVGVLGCVKTQNYSGGRPAGRWKVLGLSDVKGGNQGKGAQGRGEDRALSGLPQVPPSQGRADHSAEGKGEREMQGGRQD